MASTFNKFSVGQTTKLLLICEKRNLVALNDQTTVKSLPLKTFRQWPFWCGEDIQWVYCWVCRNQNVSRQNVVMTNVSSSKNLFNFECLVHSINNFFLYLWNRSFCPKHLPVQMYPEEEEPLNTSLIDCPVCLDNVPSQSSFDVLKTPCCHNTYVHRDCIQVRHVLCSKDQGHIMMTQNILWHTIGNVMI